MSDNLSNYGGVNAERWDNIRERFRSSMMVKTEIHKLAQNIDATWPHKSSDEIPLKYIGLTFDELHMMPELGGKIDRIKLLMDIMEETMAFDDPFGEMAEHVDSSSKKDDSAQKTLTKLEINPAYPLRFCLIAPESKEFCEREGLTTVGEFIDFTQNMAQNIVVGGDFRNFLNSFVSGANADIARYLPLRAGHHGLHLAEAIAQFISLLKPEEYVDLLFRYQVEVSADDRKVRRLTKDEQADLDARIRTDLGLLLAFFEEESNRLRDALAEGGAAPERFFVPLDNRKKETLALALVRTYYQPSEAAPKKGFFSRLFGR